MRAYMMEADDDRDYNVSLQYYRSALSVLEWGQQTWKDVPTSQRGVIFVPTFVRGIRRFYLNEYLKVCFCHCIAKYAVINRLCSGMQSKVFHLRYGTGLRGAGQDGR